jgi:hypothetical protein
MTQDLSLLADTQKFVSLLVLGLAARPVTAALW